MTINELDHLFGVHAQISVRPAPSVLFSGSTSSPGLMLNHGQPATWTHTSGGRTLTCRSCTGLAHYALLA